MQQPSIKKNFAYKSVLTLSTYLIGFVTFPYVSRVLGVEKIGLVEFVNNTVDYFLLFATLGVNLLGVREIAAVKASPEARSRVFSRILGLNLSFTLLTLLIYFFLVAAVPKLHQYSELFYIGTAKIIFTALLVEWFFTGIEDFRYITLRSMLIKTLYVAAIFTWVRDPEDYKLYFILTTGVVVVNALINMLYVRKSASIHVGELVPRHYIKTNLALGFYAVMTSMYLTFNVIFLGLASNNTQVGYYTTAFKLYAVILGLFSAFTSVMLPRMSALVAEGENQQFQQMVDKSFRAFFTFCIPLTICSVILAPQIIYVLSGTGFEGAVTPMRIIMPAVLFVSVAQVLAIQILMPLKKDRILLYASIIGAVVSLILNFTLVPYLQSTGTAIVLICAETAVTATYIVYTLRNRLASIPVREIGKNILCTLPSAAICLACGYWIPNPFAALGAAIAAAGVCWAVIQFTLHPNAAAVLLPIHKGKFR